MSFCVHYYCKCLSWNCHICIILRGNVSAEFPHEKLLRDCFTLIQLLSQITMRTSWKEVKTRKVKVRRYSALYSLASLDFWFVISAFYTIFYQIFLQYDGFLSLNINNTDVKLHRMQTRPNVLLERLLVQGELLDLI